MFRSMIFAFLFVKVINRVIPRRIMTITIITFAISMFATGMFATTVFAEGKIITVKNWGRTFTVQDIAGSKLLIDGDTIVKVKIAPKGCKITETIGEYVHWYLYTNVHIHRDDSSLPSTEIAAQAVVKHNKQVVNFID